MIRFLAPALVCLSLAACDPPPKPAAPDRVWQLGAADLYRSYLDYSDRWTGYRVQVTLAPGTYTPVKNGIHWPAGSNSDPPGIVFVCTPPPDASRWLVVIGTCRGRKPLPERERVVVEVTECSVLLR